MARAILVEAASLTFLSGTYPLRLLHDASPKRARACDHRPVILVHGYGGNSANFLWMQWRLRRQGFRNVYAVSYTPPHINARKLAAQVARHVENVLARTGAEQVDLVCHSMGGPLTRYALKNLGLAGKVNKVITLGSPHYGTRISSLSRPGARPRRCVTAAPSSRNWRKAASARARHASIASTQSWTTS